MAVHDRRSRTGWGLGAVWFSVREVGGMAWAVLALRLGTVRSRGAPGAKRGGTTMFDTVWQDLRFAARTLRRNPGFGTTAVVVLALGIGANTAIFSAVNSFFFRPLPFSDADRLVTVFETNPEFGWEDATAAPANLLDWRDQVQGFEDVSGFFDFRNQVTTFREGEPFLLGGSQVLGNFFSTLGVPAALGRTFRFEETWAGEDNVVVISHDLWQNHFGSDPGIVGKKMEFATSAPEIIGVMPEGFRYPSEETEIWFTPGWATDARDEVWFRRAHMIRAFARLAPGIGAQEADAQLQVAVGRLQLEYPETNQVMGAGMIPMREFLIKEVRTQLLVLLGAVGLLLLLACSNVANLMLVRAGDRRREVALRHALGAGRGRVVRQMLTESLLIGTLGGVVGLGLGWAGVMVLSASNPLGIEGATSLALDFRVVLFTLSVAILSSVLFGSAPAARASSRNLQGALRDGGRGGSVGRHGLRAVGLLVTVEVALALVIVVGAGLMGRSFWLLREVDPGFETEGVVAVQFSIPSARYAERDQVLAFYDQLAEALEARPGIEKVGTVQYLPLSGQSWTSQFQAEGWPPERVGFEIGHRRADKGYFEAVGTPLLDGRMFEPTDGPEDPLVVLVNEAFVREHFPAEDPVGQKIAFDRVATPESAWYEIIGIVGDQHQQSPGTPPRAEVFEHQAQDWARNNWVVIRGDMEAERVVPIARAVLTEIDPLIPIAQIHALRDVWSDSMAREEFLLTLLGAFGLVALLLASVGVYGVTSQAARRRTQEIGIRMALGAEAPDVLRMIIGQGVVLIGLGLGLGLVGALLATRVLASQLDGVDPTDPLTLGGVALSLGLIGLTACYLPARRATRVDPVRALNSE